MNNVPSWFDPAVEIFMVAFGMLGMYFVYWLVTTLPERMRPTEEQAALLARACRIAREEPAAKTAGGRPDRPMYVRRRRGREHRVNT